MHFMLLLFFFIITTRLYKWSGSNAARLYGYPVKPRGLRKQTCARRALASSVDRSAFCIRAELLIGVEAQL